MIKPEKSEVPVCAPIIIPTCNRARHLKACVESLQNNTLSNYTDIFISVDYPPNDLYKKGYEETCLFVNRLKNNSNFRSVHCFFQSTNLGIYKNSWFLKNELRKNGFETYIETEDDNVFSKNFLDYCNRNLIKYDNDDSIVMICANQKDNKESIANSTIKDHYCRLWGHASWISRFEEVINWINTDNILKFSMNIHSMIRFRWYNEGAFNNLVNGILFNHSKSFFYNDGSVGYPDFLQCLYLYENKKFAIFPQLNLVQNIGVDGTGINSKKGDNGGNIEDHREYYDLREEAIYVGNRRIDVSKGFKGKLRSLKTLAKYFLWRIFIRKIR